MSDRVKYLLEETRLPKDWYNIVADLPRPPEPVLHPGTLKPVGPQDLEPLFPMTLIQQEVSAERTIEIPEPVRRILPSMAALTALSSARAGAGARYACQNLLQIRRGKPGGEP